MKPRHVLVNHIVDVDQFLKLLQFYVVDCRRKVRLTFDRIQLCLGGRPILRELIVVPVNFIFPLPKSGDLLVFVIFTGLLGLLLSLHLVDLIRLLLEALGIGVTALLSMRFLKFYIDQLPRHIFICLNF